MSFFQRMLRTTEFLRAVPKSDQFIEGALTPEEFVTAGDFLVRKCGTWQWEAGDPAKARSYLPADKQYLVTRQDASRLGKCVAAGQPVALGCPGPAITPAWRPHHRAAAYHTGG
ncbi:autophagy-like protein 3 [Fonticula alba]|uniref:Autophagy-like protein 3 n=1 Tax=Fonticula alba TaxID=691883 RepID=A0A058Z7B2_FONAL|nr:autophagy-like protein 3 [Fonticula alba]KCV70189.1 autophagy-like protein 3 [Fonticula alba]|eukprot:XP_009495795.1 autophagy-like protein 3 [Fonticula alba]